MSVLAGLQDVFVPAGLSPAIAVLLVVAAFFTSALTAAFGVGGGVALLGLMGFFMPVAALVPVHGIVQLGSNLGRAAVQIRHVNWPLVGVFFVGGLAGAALGGRFVVTLPDLYLKVAIGLFILWAVWGRKPGWAGAGLWSIGLGGAFSSFLTMFIGATGPFVAAVLKVRGLQKVELVATHGACMVQQHGLKMIVFGLLGFAFGPWIGLTAAMIASGFAGTLSGTALLKRLPDEGFLTGFRWVMTAMAVFLILNAVLKALE
ncbi:MAG: TSUP family transporter [Hyphomicrobiaceae bacterium]|nr:TSUP family transporter [Hyphomicrobiaceae bacterium]